MIRINNKFLLVSKFPLWRYDHKTTVYTLLYENYIDISNVELVQIYAKNCQKLGTQQLAKAKTTCGNTA